MVRAMGALSAMLVAVVVAVAAAQNTLLVDCGSPTLDPDSRVTNAAGTQKIGGTSQVDLPNTSFDSRFRTQRELRAGQTSFAYTFTVATSGDFSVVLSFAELRTNLCTAGARAFDIYANNRLVESRFDIASRAGGCNRALTRTLRVTVGADRRLVLRFQKSGNNQPTISAIEYTRLGNGPATPTPTPSPRPNQAATCDGLGIVTRKDIRDFSQTEWTNYVNAWKALGARASGKVQSGINLNAVEWLSQAHLESALHNQPLFLVWHRVMLWEFDKALHSVAPGVRQPYFDWSTASSNLFGSSIFGSSRYGGNGPVTGGSFAVLTSAVGSPGTRHTVVRNFNSGVQVVNRNTINGITATNTGFDTFRRALESAHNAFHNAVGGDMMTQWSPNDPLFYAHHAFIDKAFRDWELRSRANVFSGDNLARAMTPWATTGNTAQTSLAGCVVYQNTNAANRVTPSPSKSSDPVGYQKAVNEANKAKKDAAAAAILLGATPEQAEAAKRALEAINKEMGLDLADAQ